MYNNCFVPSLILNTRTFLCPRTGNVSHLLKYNLPRNNPPRPSSLALTLTHPGVILSHSESLAILANKRGLTNPTNEEVRIFSLSMAILSNKMARRCYKRFIKKWWKYPIFENIQILLMLNFCALPKMTPGWLRIRMTFYFGKLPIGSTVPWTPKYPSIN